MKRSLSLVAAAAIVLLFAGGTSEAKRRRHRKHRPAPAAAPATEVVPAPPTETESETDPAEAPPPPPARAPRTAAVDAPPAPDASERAPQAAEASPAPPAETDRPAAGAASPPAAPPPSSSAPPSSNALVPMKGKWSPVLYGFVELDMIHDSTQTYVELPGNAAIPRTETFAGSHGRTTFGARHSRLGFKLTAPELEGVKASAIIEMDFLGNQPANPPGLSEVAFFSNPAFRIRHFAFKVETEYLDLLFGQFWQLFGWQSYFHPNSVQIPGLPGQVFSRTPQARLSHVFKGDAVSVEAALAAARPPQRDSETPDGQGGLRALFNGRKALHTGGAVGTAVDAMGIGVSGVVRRFVLPEPVAAPVATRGASGWGVSVDALLPLITGTMDDRANALTLTGSYVTGTGIADLYTGLTGGIGAPAYPAPTMGAALVAPVDAGLVFFDGGGVLRTIDWTSTLVGLQYYLPPSGKVWIAANYSHMSSANIARLAAPAAVFSSSDWVDGNLFWEVTPAVRFGLGYSFFRQTRGDGERPTNQRVQLSSWFVF